MKKVNPKLLKKKLTDFLHTVGDNLYALRINRKATLKTVAKEIKISPRRLSKIEKGLCPHCKFGTLVLLCKYYQIILPDIAIKGKFKVMKICLYCSILSFKHSVFLGGMNKSSYYVISVLALAVIFSCLF